MCEVLSAWPSTQWAQWQWPWSRPFFPLPSPTPCSYHHRPSCPQRLLTARTTSQTVFLPFEAPAFWHQSLLTPLPENSVPPFGSAPMKPSSPLHPFVHTSPPNRTVLSVSLLTHTLPPKARLREPSYTSLPHPTMSCPQQGWAPFWHGSFSSFRLDATWEQRPHLTLLSLSSALPSPSS